MSLRFDTSHTAASAAGAAATITLTAPGVGFAWEIEGAWFSYSAAPTNGGLTVTDGGNTVLQLHVTAAGPAPLPMPEKRKGGENSAVVFTLAGGGGAVVGKLNVFARKIPTP